MAGVAWLEMWNSLEFCKRETSNSDLPSAGTMDFIPEADDKRRVYTRRRFLPIGGVAQDSDQSGDGSWSQCRVRPRHCSGVNTLL